MAKITKLQRRCLLDIGLRNFIDFDLFVYLVDRTTKTNNVVKFRYADFFKDIHKTCSVFTVSERNIYRILKRLVEIGMVKIQVSGFGEALVEVYSLDQIFRLSHPEMTDWSNVVVDENEDGESDAEAKAPQRGIEQQQLIYADQKCRSVGINYQKKDLWKIAKYSKELIDLAVNCFKSSDVAESTHIRNPAGWLIKCLEKKYYLSHRPEKLVKSAEQKLFELQDWFLDNFGTIPSRQLELNFSYKKTGLPA